MSCRYTHDPDDVLDYGFDLSAWLLPGDSVDSAEIAGIVPTGLSASAPTFSKSIVSSVISGGLINTRYKVTFRITTTAGRVIDRTLTFDCRNR